MEQCLPDNELEFISRAAYGFAREGAYFNEPFASGIAQLSARENKMALSAEKVEKLIRDWIPMAEQIDLRVEAIEEGHARIRIPFDESNKRPGGSVSGPTLMAAGDTAMYAAILGMLGEVAMAVTSNLNINFMQRPGEVDIIAEGKILKMGKRIAYCEVDIYTSESTDLVAHVTGSYALPPER